FRVDREPGLAAAFERRARWVYRGWREIVFRSATDPCTPAALVRAAMPHEKHRLRTATLCHNAPHITESRSQASRSTRVRVCVSLFALEIESRWLLLTRHSSLILAMCPRVV